MYFINDSGTRYRVTQILQGDEARRAQLPPGTLCVYISNSEGVANASALSMTESRWEETKIGVPYKIHGEWFKLVTSEVSSC
jgi:hypothetical protein